MKICFKSLIIILIALSNFTNCFSWGFYAHKKINRIAIYSLPVEMFNFYKLNIDYITEHATSPDKRRYIIKAEAGKHFIDFEDFGDSSLYKLPKHYLEIIKQFHDDSLQKFGSVPWHIQKVCYQLTEAFRVQNKTLILKLSADLGHYVADANVPLHTTKNYNGQLTDQIGIHGFWESRLPELFSDQYDLFIGHSAYVNSISDYSWNMVTKANNCLDSVLNFEKILHLKTPSDKKYSFEERGNTTIKVYSKRYSTLYHEMLNGQVERQMRAAIKSTSDLWYTCWINAGQPNLNQLINNSDLENNEDTLPLIQDQIIREEAHVIIEEMNSCDHIHKCCDSKEVIVYIKPSKFKFMFIKKLF